MVNTSLGHLSVSCFFCSTKTVDLWRKFNVGKVSNQQLPVNFIWIFSSLFSLLWQRLRAQNKFRVSGINFETTLFRTGIKMWRFRPKSVFGLFLPSSWKYCSYTKVSLHSRWQDKWSMRISRKTVLHWLDKTQSTGTYSIIIQDYVDTQTRPFFGSAASSGTVYKILEAGWRDLFHVNIGYILKQWSLDFHYLFQWFPPKVLKHCVESYSLCFQSQTRPPLKILSPELRRTLFL